MHPTCVEDEGFEAVVCIVGFGRGYHGRGCIVRVVSSGLFGDV